MGQQAGRGRGLMSLHSRNAKCKMQNASTVRFAFGILTFALLAASTNTSRLAAQQAQGAPPPPAVQQTARQASPIDFTGTWASVVTEDWQWRFVTPIVGDYTGIPLNSTRLNSSHLVISYAV